MGVEILKGKKLSQLTDHAAAEEQGLNQPDLVLILTDQSPLRCRRTSRATAPFPRTWLQPTNAGAAGAADARPRRFPIGEDHNHGVKGLESPSEAGEDEVSQLPRPKLTAVPP